MAMSDPSSAQPTIADDAPQGGVFSVFDHRSISHRSC
jgi:hypothetical protein